MLSSGLLDWMVIFFKSLCCEGTNCLYTLCEIEWLFSRIFQLQRNRKTLVICWKWLGKPPPPLLNKVSGFSPRLFKAVRHSGPQSSGCVAKARWIEIRLSECFLLKLGFQSPTVQSGAFYMVFSGVLGGLFFCASGTHFARIGPNRQACARGEPWILMLATAKLKVYHYIS